VRSGARIRLTQLRKRGRPARFSIGPLPSLSWERKVRVGSGHRSRSRGRRAAAFQDISPPAPGGKQVIEMVHGSMGSRTCLRIVAVSAESGQVAGWPRASDSFRVCPRESFRRGYPSDPGAVVASHGCRGKCPRFRCGGDRRQSDDPTGDRAEPRISMSWAPDRGIRFQGEPSAYPLGANILFEGIVGVLRPPHFSPSPFPPSCCPWAQPWIGWHAC
jgi:hypothetical protein